MKKILKYTLAILVVLGMMLTVTGCGNKDKDQKEYNKDNEVVANQTENNKDNEVTTNQTENNKDNDVVTNQMDNKASEVNKKENSTKTYDNLKGTYESQKINMNKGTNDEPYYTNYTIVLSQEGTFAAYYNNGDTDCHYVGYYTIGESQIVLNSVIFVGNDPSASLCNDVFKFKINNDGTFSDNDNNKFTKTSSTPIEDTNIAKIIDSYMAGCTTSGKDGEGPWFSGPLRPGGSRPGGPVRPLAGIPPGNPYAGRRSRRRACSGDRPGSPGGGRPPESGGFARRPRFWRPL